MLRILHFSFPCRIQNVVVTDWKAKIKIAAIYPLFAAYLEC